MSLSRKLAPVILVLASIFINSCASTNQALNQIPSWYINPKQNNSQFLYGVAQGYNLHEAKTAALYEASSRLSSTVSATTNLIREENNYSTNEEIRQNIKQTSAEIKFNNYKVINSEVVNTIFYVEIEIEKSEFVKFYREEIEKLYQKIIDLDRNSANQNIISRYSLLKKISELSNKIDFYKSVLSSLGGKALASEKLKNLQKLNQEKDSLNLVIEFYIDKSSPKDIGAIVSQAISKQNIKLIMQDTNSNNSVRVKITILENRKQLFGQYMNNLTIKLESFAKNKLVKNNNIEVTGSSASDYSLARKSALRKFENMINNQGIFNILGID